MMLTAKDSKIMGGKVTISETLREMWYINTHNIAESYLEYLHKIKIKLPGKNIIFER